MNSIEQSLIDPINDIEVVWLIPKSTLNVGDENIKYRFRITIFDFMKPLNPERRSQLMTYLKLWIKILAFSNPFYKVDISTYAEGESIVL